MGERGSRHGDLLIVACGRQLPRQRQMNAGQVGCDGERVATERNALPHRLAHAVVVHLQRLLTHRRTARADQLCGAQLAHGLYEVEHLVDHAHRTRPELGQHLEACRQPQGRLSCLKRHRAPLKIKRRAPATAPPKRRVVAFESTSTAVRDVRHNLRRPTERQTLRDGGLAGVAAGCPPARRCAAAEAWCARCGLRTRWRARGCAARWP